MDNITAARSLCNAICNTFYPDNGALNIALFNEGIDPAAEAAAKDPQILKVAIHLVLGYVEGSRSEGGVSASVRSQEAVTKSIRIWCANYGIDADEMLSDTLTMIDNISDMW